jgi:H+/Cl- antiporter ClcA
MPPAAFDSGISKSVEQATAGEPVDGGGAVVRAAAGVVTLGAGCSLGPEGPSVELGTTISRVALLAASALGAGELRPAQRRSLACAGTAAGVAAGFNAPLAAVAFAYEVAAKLRPFSVAAGNGDGAAAEPRPSFAPIALASGSAALAMRVLLSDGSLSFMPSLAAGSAVSLVDLPTFVLLGTCCGGGAVVFRLGLSRARSLFAGPVSARLGKPLQPIAGSVACAVIAAAVPQVEFSSYETLDGLVSEWSTLSTPANPLVLYAGKLVATCLCAGSGLVGGIFAPSLFLGAALGAAFSQATSEFTALLGAHVVDASDLILVGAASVLAAVFSSPITSALLVFDLTHDAQLLLPSLVAATVATALCDELAQN